MVQLHPGFLQEFVTQAAGVHGQSLLTKVNMALSMWSQNLGLLSLPGIISAAPEHFFSLKKKKKRQVVCVCVSTKGQLWKDSQDSLVSIMYYVVEAS